MMVMCAGRLGAAAGGQEESQTWRTFSTPVYWSEVASHVVFGEYMYW